MSNKTLKTILIILVLLAVTLTAVKLTGIDKDVDFKDMDLSFGNAAEKEREEKIDKIMKSDFFDDFEENVQPNITPINITSSSRYEAVHEYSISPEKVKNPVEINCLVPQKYRRLYVEILCSLNDCVGEIDLITQATEDDVKRAIIYVRDLNPQLFYVDWSSYSFNSSGEKIRQLKMKFLFDDVKKAKKEFDSAVDGIISEANKLPNLFERELYVHDYLVNNTTYLVDDGDTGTAYGAIVNKKARCEGYARAFQLLMLRLGIPTISVTGISENDTHMWNKVDLYGKYYNVDVTFDDDSSISAVTNLTVNEISHSCFNVTDSIINRTHTQNPLESKDQFGSYQTLITFDCNSDDFNYYRIKGLSVKNASQLKYLFEKYSSEKRVTVFFETEMPSIITVQQAFSEYFKDSYRSGGYTFYYNPEQSSVYLRNVYEINWELN